MQMSNWKTKKMRKNPTSREKQTHQDSGHAVYRSWCAACVEGRGVGGQHRIELLEEDERERTTPIVACEYGFLTQENADTFPILICRDIRYGQTGATCCERKGPTAYSISFLVGFIKDLAFRRIISKYDNVPSTKALQDAVIHACVGVEVIPQGPPECDQVMNKMRIGKDSKTSEMRRIGRRWRKPMAQFGEEVWFRKIWRRRCQLFFKSHHSRNLCGSS